MLELLDREANEAICVFCVLLNGETAAELRDKARENMSLAVLGKESNP
jgi:hypothetical protein